MAMMSVYVGEGGGAEAYIWWNLDSECVRWHIGIG